MSMPWRQPNRLSEWSHRIIVLPEHGQLLDAARLLLSGDGNDGPALRAACARVGVRSIMQAAKTLTTHQRSAASLLTVYFCGPDAFPEPPNKIGLSRLEHAITRTHVKAANPLIAIVLDLRPSLDLDRQEMRLLIDEDRFWDHRRELIKSIGSALCDALNMRLTTVAYDPLADEEIEDDQKVVVGIRPNLVVHHYGDGRPTRGYYITPHEHNTVTNESPDTSWICHFLMEFDQQLHGAQAA